jgi:hypothetical protein
MVYLASLPLDANVHGHDGLDRSLSSYIDGPGWSASSQNANGDQLAGNALNRTCNIRWPHAHKIAALGNGQRL